MNIQGVASWHIDKIPITIDKQRFYCPTGRWLHLQVTPRCREIPAEAQAKY